MKVAGFLSDDANTVHQTRTAVLSMGSVSPKECIHFQQVPHVDT